MLTELRRVEERLQPFIQRAHLILEAATTADYNNNVRSPLLINVVLFVDLSQTPCLNVNAKEFGNQDHLFSQQNIKKNLFTFSVDKDIKTEL